MENIRNKLNLYTEGLIVGKKSGQIFEKRGTGTGIWISYQNNNFFVSCSHCCHSGSLYFSGLGVELEFFRDHKGLDIAIFRTQQKTIKNFYSLDNNNTLSLSQVQKNLGCSSYIYGFPNFLDETTINFSISNGKLKYQVDGAWKDYLASGPIIEANKNMIVADFAEKEVIFDKSGHNIQPTGGMRDIKGMSGSGLWVEYNNNVILLGILLKRKEQQNLQQEHLIEFTPIWELEQFLSSLVKRKTV